MRRRSEAGTYHWHAPERAEVLLAQEVGEDRHFGRVGLGGGSTVVAQDGGVDAALEPDVAKPRIGSDPIVVHWLVGVELQEPQ